MGSKYALAPHSPVLLVTSLSGAVGTLLLWG